MMNITVSETPAELGQRAARKIAELIGGAVAERGEARVVLSTGASQFETLSALLELEVPWEQVVIFHLDEYVGLPQSHPASFRRYLRERLLEKVRPKAAHLVDGEGDIDAHIRELSREIRKSPVDVGVVGIGENGHIAFNDPPADFDAAEAFFVVALAERCKRQQVGEGWFATVEEVPEKAITMTVGQIMSCRHIVSGVPHAAKAAAIREILTQPVSPLYPGSILKTHPSWHLYVDKNSASALLPL